MNRSDKCKGEGWREAREVKEVLRKAGQKGERLKDALGRVERGVRGLRIGYKGLYYMGKEGTG